MKRSDAGDVSPVGLFSLEPFPNWQRFLFIHECKIIGGWHSCRVSAMSEESGVEVCNVCQEIFLEEAALKSHMKELHPDVKQCRSEEVGSAERHSTVVAILEKQKEVTCHDGLDQALAAGENSRTKGGPEKVGILTEKHEGCPESKRRRRECSVKETSEDERKPTSSREVSRSPRKSCVGSKHDRKDYREKDRKRSDGREDGSLIKQNKGREGERKDQRDDRNQNKGQEKSGNDLKAAHRGMSRNFGQSEVRKREHSDSKKPSKEKLSRSPPRGNGRDVKDEIKEKVARSPLRGNIKQSTHGGQDSSRASVKDFVSRGSVREHDNWNGPACPKCDQICKDKGGLRNHVLSHYYEVFFEVGFTILIFLAASILLIL